jgi:transposase
MAEISTIGIDSAKRVFQVHGVDGDGNTVLRKKLGRESVLAFFAKLPPCLVGMEACGAAHHWAREIAAFGHDVRVMPPTYVKPFVRRSKNDAADAEACCIAVRQPNMRFVPVKSAEQQGNLAVHTVRDLLIRQRTQAVNSLRGTLAEFGVTAPVGLERAKDLVAVVEDEADPRLPLVAREALRLLTDQIADLDRRIAGLETAITAMAKADPAAKRIMTVPGIGPITASRLVATVPDPGVFPSGRDFAAWLGLVPRQNSTGGRSRLGRISKQGNGDLRRLLVSGAMAALFRSKDWRNDPWLLALRARKPAMVTAVALANKMARTVWAILVRGGEWRSRRTEIPAVLAVAAAD